MQLTKDDIHADSFYKEDTITDALDFSKFQQVVEFYERYRDDEGYHRFRKEKNVIPECLSFMEYLRDKISVFSWSFKDWNTWLFNYCFKDGWK